MIENYIKEADRVTYLMPKEVDHHCAGQIIAELDALIEGCGVRKIVFDMKQTEFMDSSGIGLVMGRYKICESMGASLEIHGLSRHAYKVMCLAGLQNLAVLKKKKEAEKSETA